MAKAARERSRDDNRPGADESGARPIWKHLDELEGGTPIPLDAKERADVDALLREIGAMPNPELQPPVIRSETPPPTSPRRFLQVPTFTLTILGAVAFTFGLFATMAVLQWNRAAADEPSAVASSKVVTDHKRVVVIQLPPFTITGRVPDLTPAVEPEAPEESPATAAATWHPPQLAPGDAPPIITPMGVASPGGEPVALSDATDRQIDAVIAGLASPAPREVLASPAEPEQHAAFTPPVPASMP